MRGHCLAGHAWTRSVSPLTGVLATALLATFPVVAEARLRDRDGDGLSNRYELKRSHTNPRKADSDGDHLRDRFELRRSRTNPLDRDTDDDGLRDGFEWRRSKTSPRRHDTDRDGLSDGLEVLLGSDPRAKQVQQPGLLPPPPSAPGGSSGPSPGAPPAGPTQSPTGPPSPPAGHCDSTVTTTAQIVSAAASAANEGKAVCVAAGTYGTLALDGVSHPADRKVTLRSQARHQAVFSRVVLEGVIGLRLEDFRVQGGFEHPSDGSIMQAVDFVGNDVGGTQTGAFVLNCKVYDVLFESNHIHDIQDTEDFWTGWGIKLTGSPSGSLCDWRRNIRIRYNTFERLGNDAMDIGATIGGEIVANVVRDVNKGPLDPDEHTDALMFWAGSRDFLIRDNRWMDNHDQWLLSGGTQNLTAINNLFVRGGQWGIQAGEAGSSSAGIHNSVFRNNTVWSTGGSWNDQCSPAHPTTNCMGVWLRGQSSQTNTFDRNLVDSLSGCGFVSAGGHNLMYDSSPGPCTPTDALLNPQFADTVDYQPTNLPTGFEDVGYKPVPAGHTAPPQPTNLSLEAGPGPASGGTQSPGRRSTTLRIVGLRPRGKARRESVTIANVSRRAVDLRGHSLRDRSGRRIRFRQRLRLRPGVRLRVVTGCPARRREAFRRRTRFYACRKRELWNDSGDVVHLLDTTGRLLSRRGYGRFRRGA
jgi:Lamin Tail Domain/Right handed beta helix region/Bacterial TSP3 repeat